MTNSTMSPNNFAFLEKVKNNGHLEDIYDARDMTEVVYRTMRDLMPTQVIDQVESDLKKESNEISELWKDRNPLVAWLSRIRPPFQGEAPFAIDDELFIRRVEQEGGMPKGTNGQTVIKAVFKATKQELSQTRIDEIENFLPGKIKELWQQA